MKTKEFSGRRPQHIVAKIVCLLLAVVLWLYVMYVAAPEYDLVYHNIPVTVIATSDYPFTGEIDNALISVRVRGTKAKLAEYDSTDITAYVRLSDVAGEGSGLTPDNLYTATVQFTMPEGLTVEGEYTVPVFVQAK